MNGEIELEMSLVSYLLGSISDPLSSRTSAGNQT